MNDKYKLLIDAPSNKPALGYNEYASTFAEIIQISTPRFAIGIFGGWGSGKSTLMQAIHQKINSDFSIPVEFNAWRYEKEEHLIVPFLETVKDSLNNWSESQTESTVKEKTNHTISTITKVITSFIAGLNIKFGLPQAFEISYDVSKTLAESKNKEWKRRKSKNDDLKSLYYTCFTSLKESFNGLIKIKKDLRIVVFIDDLDRCLPEGVMRVLEFMKLFFDILGFIFVVGLDQKVVEWCIDRAYSIKEPKTDGQKTGFQIRGEDYIKKIFQVPFTLFPVSISQLDQFLEALIDENKLSGFQADEIRDRIRPHLSYIINESEINPREIKRFINAYTLNIKIKPDLDPDAVLALKTISFRSDWQVVQEALYTSGEVFLESLKKYLVGEVEILTGLNPLYESVPQSFFTYISEGAPGHALVTASPLDEYIRTGAATSSQGNPQLLELIQTIGKLRENVLNNPDKESLNNDLLNARKLLDGFVYSSESGERPEPHRQAAIRSIEQLNRRIDTFRDEPWDDPEAATNLKKEYEKLIAEIITNLVSYYRSGEVMQGYWK